LLLLLQKQPFRGGELKGRRRQRTEKVGISLRQGLTLLSLSSIVVLLLLRESLWPYVLEDVKDYQGVTERGRILQCIFFFTFFRLQCGDNLRCRNQKHIEH
jgi:hypothetical protein